MPAPIITLGVLLLLGWGETIYSRDMFGVKTRARRMSAFHWRLILLVPASIVFAWGVWRYW